MKVQINVAENDSEHRHISQEVNFLYAFDGRAPTNTMPQKQEYLNLLGSSEDVLIAMNYTIQDTIKSPLGESSSGAKGFTNITIYRREIWNDNGEEGGESTYHPVIVNSKSPIVVDYNISNKRNYEYIAYPSITGAQSVLEKKGVKRYVSTNWGYWSLIELHPYKNSKTQFYTTASDVWLFKYNVSVGELTQNISKTQQDNLTAYPTFSHGPKNNLSGSVSALLGSEITNYDLASQKSILNIQPGGTISQDEKWIKIIDLMKNGYTEKMKYFPQLTSNQKIDMLNQWRNIAFSGNPKLLRDISGQSFLVQITSSTNTTNENWNKMPDTISFSWTQIGTLDNIWIVNKEAYE